MIRNRSTFNLLRIRYGTPGVGAELDWDLYPGEVLTLELDGRIQSGSDGIIVSTASGTCPFSVLVNAFESDRGDLNQSKTPGLT